MYRFESLEGEYRKCVWDCKSDRDFSHLIEEEKLMEEESSDFEDYN